MSDARTATKRERDRTQSATTVRGDEEELFERYADHLLRVVAGATRASRETVEDACSFAWAQLLRKQPTRDSVVGWLRVVAIHEVYRLWHKTRDQSSLEAPYGDPDAAASVAFERTPCGTDDVPLRVELDAVLAEIAQLPQRRRRIFELHLSGFSYDEIGVLTGEGPRAINRQITKARTRLRRDFADPDPS